MLGYDVNGSCDLLMSAWTRMYKKAMLRMAKAYARGQLPGITTFLGSSR